MKNYIFLLFLVVSFHSMANEAVEEKSDEETVKEDNIDLIKTEISNLRTKIDKIEGEIIGLSNQMKNIENSLVTNNQNVNSQVPNKTLSQKNYDEEKQNYDSALISLKDGEYDLAEQKFSKFINDYPDSSLLSNAYFWYGESYYRKKDYKNSGIYFLNGYRKFPRGIKASDSLLKLAISLGNLGKGDDACKIINKLQNEFKERSMSSMQKEKEILEKYNCQK